MVGNRIFARGDLDQHNTRKSCWVSWRGKVYDVTEFLDDHPGGDDLILPFAGKELGNVMADPSEHVHSQSAYEMLDEMKIGELGGDEQTVSEDWVADENFHPEDTDVSSDFNKNKFLDLSKPLLAQVWNAPWSKQYYLSQVHNPRHLKESARLFKWDILEALTRTKWYVVPIMWGPITMFIFYLSMLQFSDSRVTAGDLFQWPLPRYPMPEIMSLIKVLPCFVIGNIVWTLLEYGMHRFLFHIDDHLPDRNWALMLHFLLHGVHHYLPMDGLRLVMPPTLFFILQAPFTRLAHLIFPKAIANGIIAGAFTFYILYDCCHYALHHTRLPAYLTQLKRYHLAHHYKNWESAFGVTSKLWDVVFGTELMLDCK